MLIYKNVQDIRSSLCRSISMCVCSVRCEVPANTNPHKVRVLWLLWGILPYCDPEKGVSLPKLTNRFILLLLPLSQQFSLHVTGVIGMICSPTFNISVSSNFQSICVTRTLIWYISCSCSLVRIHMPFLAGRISGRVFWCMWWDL